MYVAGHKACKVKEISHDSIHDLTFYCTHNQLYVWDRIRSKFRVLGMNNFELKLTFEKTTTWLQANQATNCCAQQDEYEWEHFFMMSACVLASLAVKGCCRTQLKPFTKYTYQLITNNIIQCIKRVKVFKF